MTWDGVRRWLVRLGGAAQLAVITGTAASFVGTLAGPLWRQSRPGCVVYGMVTCTAEGIDLAGRWPAAIAGGLLALAAVMTARRLRRVAQSLVLFVVTLGTAAFAADQARYYGDRAMVCYSYGHGCTYPAWSMRALIAGAAVGVVLALLALAGEQASRRALDAPALGARRVVAAVVGLVVGQILRTRRPKEAAPV